MAKATSTHAQIDAARHAKRWNLTATPETRELASRMAQDLGVSESKLVAMALVALDDGRRVRKTK